jgi:hypothetical protein
MALEWQEKHQRGVCLFGYEATARPNKGSLRLSIHLNSDSSHSNKKPFEERFHGLVGNIRDSFLKKCHKLVSKFTLGQGIWKCSSTFKILPLNDSDKKALERILKTWSGKHQSKPQADRRKNFGSPALKSSRPPAISRHTGVVTPSPSKVGTGVAKSSSKCSQTILPFSSKHRSAKTRPQAAKHQVWFSLLTDSRVHHLRMQYYNLQMVLYHLELDHQLVPPRTCWEDAFTTECKETPTCLKCRQCRMRFAQATLVVVAAQGVSC